MPDYAAEVSDLEKRVEEQAPGILRLLETYGRLEAPTEQWQRLDQGTIRFSTETTRHPRR